MHVELKACYLKDKTKVLKICEAFGANNERSKYLDEGFVSFHVFKKKKLKSPWLHSGCFSLVHSGCFSLVVTYHSI